MDLAVVFRNGLTKVAVPSLRRVCSTFARVLEYWHASIRILNRKYCNKCEVNNVFGSVGLKKMLYNIIFL